MSFALGGVWREGDVESQDLSRMHVLDNGAPEWTAEDEQGSSLTDDLNPFRKSMVRRLDTDGLRIGWANHLGGV